MNIIEILDQLDDDIGLLFKTEQWLHSEKSRMSAEASDILNRLKAIDNAINLKKVLNNIDIGALRHAYDDGFHGKENLMLELIKSYLNNSSAEAQDAAR